MIHIEPSKDMEVHLIAFLFIKFILLMSLLIYRNIFMFLFVFLFTQVDISAQIIKQVITKFDNIQNLSYTVESKRKNSFDDSVYTSKSNVIISMMKNMEFAFQETYDSKEEIYDGDKLVIFNSSDSTYDIIKNPRNIAYNYKLIPAIIAQLQDDVIRRFIVQYKKDSVINGMSYYHVKIIERDSIVNNTRTFIFTTLLVDKNNFLPYYYRFDSQGFIDGTSTFVKQRDEFFFKDYKVNTRYFKPIVIEIPYYFSLQKPKIKLPLLEKGTHAPEIELMDSLGKDFTLANQRGKVILLNFSLIGCPHCVESIDMLNRLYHTYDSSVFMIITIHPLDHERSIQKQNKKFYVRYPTFKNRNNGKINVKNYHVQGYPNFYLIDKQGKIVKGFSGYSHAIDRELSGLIDDYFK